MSNNTAFGTAEPPKRPAGPPSSLADEPKEGSSAPVDAEWEAARYAFSLLMLYLLGPHCLSSHDAHTCLI